MSVLESGERRSHRAVGLLRYGCRLEDTDHLGPLIAQHLRFEERSDVMSLAGEPIQGMRTFGCRGGRASDDHRPALTAPREPIQFRVRGRRDTHRAEQLADFRCVERQIARAELEQPAVTPLARAR